MPLKPILTLLAALAFGIAPVVTEGFAGFRPDQFPIPQDNAPVQPAGYAFSIWGVIYLWLLIYAVIGVLRYRDAEGWNGTWLPMALSMGAGAFWIKVATLSVIWATVLIWIMLLTALWALFEASKGKPNWALSWPIGLYAGWLSAASLVALGLTGAGYGLLFGDRVWALAAVIIALVVGTQIAKALPSVWTYPAALGWALAAIALTNWESAQGIGGLAAGAALVFIVFGFINFRRHLAG